jgi:hypothetical protein
MTPILPRGRGKDLIRARAGTVRGLTDLLGVTTNL